MIRTLMALASALALHAADPLVGVWELNVAKSTAEGQKLPRKIRETIIEDGKGLRIRREMVNRDGKVTDQTLQYVFDGKSHASELSEDAKHKHHTIRFERIGPGIIERKVDHDHGKLLSSYRHTISPDRRTITVLTASADEETGKPIRRTLIFEKQ